MIKFSLSNILFYVQVFSSLTTLAKGSKLTEIIIRRIDEIFDKSNNVIRSAFSENTTTEASVPNPWDNEGFIGANATQITSSLGNIIDTSTKLLLATKSSTLTTSLKDFEHTFLIIKFSSIIGHSEPEQNQEKQQDTKSEELIISQKAINGNQDEGTTSSTTAISASEDITEEVTMSTEPEPEVSQHELTEKIPTQGKSQEASIINPSVLKLNADGSHGSEQVIQISIDPAALSPLSQSVSGPKKTKRSDILTNVNSQPEDYIINTESDGRKAREKRALDSEEISQIHKILTLTKTKKAKDKGKKMKTIKEEIILSQDAQGAEEAVKDLEEKELISKGPLSPKKLPYETWRASLDKSFRPPGFYVTVDDKVIFDNWVGVWQSSQSPTVMGRWSNAQPKRKSGIWNETVLMLEFDENLDRNIKISFEWEPFDNNAYLFLSNITLSTYGANASSIGVENAVSESIHEQHNMAGNKNITLYIVVKPPDSDHSHTEKPSLEHTTKSFSGKTKQGTEKSSKENSAGTSNKKNNAVVSGGITGLVVSLVTGSLSFMILIFLIQKKFRMSRNSTSIC